MEVERLTINSEDSVVLHREIAQRFAGSTAAHKIANFERFARYAAIALCARASAYFITDTTAARRFLTPWWNLCDRFGFETLGYALRFAPHTKWAALGSSEDRVALRKRVVNKWFGLQIQPLVMKERDTCISYL